MKFLKYGSYFPVSVNTSKYSINWDRKVSKPQKKFKDFVYPYWKNHIILEEFLIPGSRFRIDIINLTKKIVVEISPRALHVDFNAWMHGGRGGYLKKLKSDASKMEWTEKNGFKFLEIYDEDLNNLSLGYIKEKFDIDLI